MKLTAPKRKGEYVELLFAAKATALGFTVAHTWGDSDPFDFLVCRGDFVGRIQVRGIFTASGPPYKLNIHVQGRMPERPLPIDTIVGYVEPADTWYVIPYQCVQKHANVMVFACDPPTQHLYECFRDAWTMLLPGPARAAALRKSPFYQRRPWSRPPRPWKLRA